MDEAKFKEVVDNDWMLNYFGHLYRVFRENGQFDQWAKEYGVDYVVGLIVDATHLEYEKHTKGSV